MSKLENFENWGRFSSADLVTSLTSLTFPIDDITTDPSTTDSSTAAPTSSTDYTTSDPSTTDRSTAAITASIATANDGITIGPSITHKSTTASTSTQEYYSSFGPTFGSSDQHEQHDFTYSGNVTTTDYYSVSSFVLK